MYNLKQFIKETIINILKEEKQQLLERVVNNSLPTSYILPRLLSKGFKTYNPNTNRSCITIWFTEKKPNQLQKANDYLFDLLERCGWTCTSWGGYYDGLRSQILNIVSENPDTNKFSTYVFNLEPNYPNELQGFNKIKLNNEWENEKINDPFYDMLYDNNTLWHTTLRKYLPRIMKNGLLPKNGHTITNWRNTQERLYLSLLPDIKRIYDTEYDEEDGEDYVLLKVDISNIKDKIKFYEDEAYKNAVFTYSSIPPQNITIVDTHTIKLMQVEKEISKHWNTMMEKILSKNQGYNEKQLLNNNSPYVKNTMMYYLFPVNHYRKILSDIEINKILNNLIKIRLKNL